MATANSAPVPAPPPKSFYLIAIGGSAMAPLAALLAARGDRVEGSDLPLYPPMSERIAALGVHPKPGFSAENVPESPDLVVVGNVAGKDNPEIQEALRRKLPVLSMAEALRDEFLASRRPLVVSGTHGKTTTTALATHLLRTAGLDPGWLVAGEPLDLPGPSGLGSGPAFVVEGDEYSTSWLDKGPKFLHYRPWALVVTSVEFDHADLYADLDAVKAAFRAVVPLVPEDGVVVANAESADVREVVAGARGRVVLYAVEDGTAPVQADAELVARDVRRDEAGATFEVVARGRPLLRATTRLAGRHNVANALAAIGAARAYGAPPDALAAGLASFRGVKRRLEEAGTARGVTVVDDFAHHPSAVETTLEGARCRYPGRRLWAVFEPRSITAGRAEFASPYRRALGLADGVAIAAPYHAARLSRAGGPGAMDAEGVARALRAAGREAFSAADADAIVAELVPRLRSGDVVVAMSSGAFGGFPRKLLAGLRESP